MYQRFYFKYCRNGHMLYSPEGEIRQEYCERCGEPYIDVCENCEAKIPNSFRGLTAFNKPLSLPKRPAFCRKCGQMYPWTRQVHSKIEESGLWEMLHPSVVEIVKRRFDSGHYADAVEAAFKAINKKVKEIYKQKAGNELDGVPLMRKAFSPSKPIIKLGDLTTETGRNIQQGYLDIFAGSITAIRNPKAHDNLSIDAERAVHFLVLASLLFFRLDEQV